MKILYIGNYNDGTGYGNGAISNMLALDSAGFEVAPRSITFNNNLFRESVPQRILELEDNDLRNIDICVQHTLPSMYSYCNGFENIGCYYSETNHIDSMMWHKYINLMDRAWVCNTQMERVAKSSGVTVPIINAPIAIDMDSCLNHNSNFTISELDNSFNFCFVGELTKRKNITTILKAFHSEFHPSENVNLFLKLNSPGLSSSQTLEKFKEVDDGILRGLKIRKNYKRVIPLTGMLRHPDLMSVVSQCHVFVCASYGEAWCIPALEAMANGLPVIYPEKTGLSDYCHGWPVETREVICSGAVDSHPEVYSALDSWQEIDTDKLMQAMRFAFQAWSYMPDLFKIQQEKAKSQAYLNSVKNVGVLLKRLICQ
jgi:glycosyltransferase involved in cell wall biosynthesis